MQIIKPKLLKNILQIAVCRTSGDMQQERMLRQDIKESLDHLEESIDKDELIDIICLNTMNMLYNRPSVHLLDDGIESSYSYRLLNFHKNKSVKLLSLDELKKDLAFTIEQSNLMAPSVEMKLIQDKGLTHRQEKIIRNYLNVFANHYNQIKGSPLYLVDRNFDTIIKFEEVSLNESPECPRFVAT